MIRQRSIVLAGALVACAASLIITQAPALSQPKADPVETVDSVAIIHGQVFDRAWRPIKLDPARLQAMQEATLAKLEAAAAPAARRNSMLAGKQLLDGATGSPLNQVTANALRIDRLAAAGSSDQSAALRRANGWLLQRLFGRPAPPPPGKGGTVLAGTGLSMQAMRKLGFDKNGVFGPLGGLGGFRPYTYSQQCAAAGVPVPPSFNTDGSTGWHMEGPLSYGILNPGADAVLYTFTPASGNGLCMALPIRKVGDPAYPAYFALGIICQGLSSNPVGSTVSTSKACFWDNADTTMMPGVTYPINGPHFIAPPNLPGTNRCSDCHAGENAFITHEGSVIDTAKQYFNDHHAKNFITQNNWYKPMLDPTWPQNPETGTWGTTPASVPGAPCASCHYGSYAGRLPDVTGAVGGHPARDQLWGFCARIASAEIASGTNYHAAGMMPGPMYPHIAQPNDPANSSLKPLYDQCNTTLPTFINFAGDAAAWPHW